MGILRAKQSGCIPFGLARVQSHSDAAGDARESEADRSGRCKVKDDELLACARQGGLIGITAVPNSLSDDPQQDIGCVLDHYDYMVQLVGIDHVAIGSDTMVGDHVDFHRKVLGRTGPGQLPAPYLNGLESPSDGKNIIRGLIIRGYSDGDIRKIAGQNALAFFRRVMD